MKCDCQIQNVVEVAWKNKHSLDWLHGKNFVENERLNKFVALHCYAMV